YRRREATQKRGHRFLRQATEDDALTRLGEVQDIVGQHRGIVGPERQIAAVLADESEADGDMHRLLRFAVRGLGQKLLKRERVGASLAVPGLGHLQLWRASLLVPQRELGKVTPCRLGEAGEEVLDRRRIAIVALEIKVHAGAEALIAENGLEHADDLGALLIDGRRVEVVDLVIERGPYRMGEGTGVLGELLGTQGARSEEH